MTEPPKRGICLKHSSSQRSQQQPANIQKRFKIRVWKRPESFREAFTKCFWFRRRRRCLRRSNALAFQRLVLP